MAAVSVAVVTWYSFAAQYGSIHRIIGGWVVVSHVWSGYCGSLAICIFGVVFFWRYPHGFEPVGHCQGCGYNLTALTEPRCPECGKPFDAKRLADIRDAHKPT